MTGPSLVSLNPSKKTLNQALSNLIIAPIAIGKAPARLGDADHGSICQLC